MFDSPFMSLPGITPQEYSYLQTATTGFSEQQLRGFLMIYRSVKEEPDDMVLYCILGFFVPGLAKVFSRSQIEDGSVILLHLWFMEAIGTIIDSSVIIKPLLLKYNQKMVFESLQMVKMGQYPIEGFCIFTAYEASDFNKAPGSICSIELSGRLWQFGTAYRKPRSRKYNRGACCAGLYGADCRWGDAYMNCNLIITIILLFLRGLRRSPGKTYVERVVWKAIRHNIALYAIHTNLDHVKNGVNGIHFSELDGKNIKMLSPKNNRSEKTGDILPDWSGR